VGCTELSIGLILWPRAVPFAYSCGSVIIMLFDSAEIFACSRTSG